MHSLLGLLGLRQFCSLRCFNPQRGARLFTDGASARSLLGCHHGWLQSKWGLSFRWECLSRDIIILRDADCVQVSGPWNDGAGGRVLLPEVLVLASIE